MGKTVKMRYNGIGGMLVAEILMLNGFDGSSLGAIPCADGGGRIDCYRLFDGVMAMRIHLESCTMESRSISARPGASRAAFRRATTRRSRPAIWR